MTTMMDTAAKRNALEARLATEKLTPMMRQYLSVKAEYPHALVLFRMGDFFEVFYEDAEECAKLLDLTLTARSKEKDIPMAGVPHHAIDNYIARLIELGRTVVLVDQVEDPKQAKGLVKRAVTRVLSPGTFVDPNAPARVPTYLAALTFGIASPRRRKKSDTWGLAALDVAAGDLRATSGTEVEPLVDELARLGVRELLVFESVQSDARLASIREALPKMGITYLEHQMYANEQIEAVLPRILGPDEATGAKTATSKEACFAAGMALSYAESSQIRPEAPDLVGNASLGHIQTLRPYVPGRSLVLDQQAREHLELFVAQGEGGRQGTLLGVIDEASTPMGARTLAQWLAYPLRDLEAIGRRHDAVSALVQAPMLLDELREGLSGVSDLERLVGRVVMGRAQPGDLGALWSSLDRAPAVLAAAKKGSVVRDGQEGSTFAGMAPEVSNTLLTSLSETDVCEDTRYRLFETLVEQPSNDLDNGEVFRAGFDSELDRLDEMAKNGKGLIAGLEAKEREATGISSLRVKYNKVFGYYIEVTKTNLSLVPKHYVRKQTTVNSERYFTEELKELETEVLTAQERRQARARALFVDLVNDVASEVKRLRTLGRALAELDVLSAFARLAEKNGWVRPQMDDSAVIQIADGRHPVIERMSEQLGESFVPNDIDVSDDERLVIITGPNMAGKSTIMRQTALIVILAQMGSFVPASSARIGVVDRVFTRVGASDDLSRGRSTFMVEMNETARILRSATSRSLILLDEIGRGTSTFDGLSIAWAVAEYLHDRVGAKTLFATHYHELTELSRDKAKAVNRHVAVKEWNDQIVFLRKLMPGPTNRSYGVQVARLAGLPTPVVQRAREVLSGLEAQALSAGNSSAVDHLIRARAQVAKEGDHGGQLFLFAPAKEAASGAEPTNEDPLAEKARGVLEDLAALSIDDITPIQALNHLSALKARLAGED